jgi:hypothetical protein
MLTEDDFRRIVLGMTGVTASAHMGHPDFRVNGRIFATLHADREWGMVKLRRAARGDARGARRSVYVRSTKRP